MPIAASSAAQVRGRRRLQGDRDDDHDRQGLVSRGHPRREAASFNAGRLSLDEDERRNIGVIVLERLARNGFEGLQRLLTVLGTGSGWPWICRVTARKARDYARDHGENLGPDSQGTPRFARLIPLSPRAEELLPDSVREPDLAEARRILDYAEQNLRPDQLAALNLRLLDDDDETIARQLGLPRARDAYLLWQGAVVRLRYQFAGKKGSRGGREKK